MNLRLIRLVFNILVCEAFGMLMLYHMFIRVATVYPLEDAWFNVVLFIIAFVCMFFVPSLMIRQYEES